MIQTQPVFKFRL